VGVAAAEAGLLRISVLTAIPFEERLYQKAVELGLMCYARMSCPDDPPFVRVEVLATPPAAEALLAFLRGHARRPYPITTTVDPVAVP